MALELRSRLEYLRCISFCLVLVNYSDPTQEFRFVRFDKPGFALCSRL